MAAKKQKKRRFRSWNAAAVLLILVMSLVVWRSWFIEARVIFHNDERHYALDGFWPRADLPPGTILGTLLYRHTRPHPFYNPRTDELGYHGTARGYAFPTDDLGTFPRAGHPALYMVLLGGFFSLFSQSWLLEADRFITVARVFNTLLDTLAWLLLFDILRRVFSMRRSLWFTLPAFLMPFTFIHGGLAYLDSPGGAFAIFGTWFYFVRVRQRPSRRNWAILGVLLGAGILIKQSGVFLLPILFCLGLIWPPRQEWRPLIPSLLILLVVAGGVVCAGTDPSGLVRGSVESVSSTRQFRSNKQAPESGFRRLEYLMNAGEHYHFGTGPGRPIPFVDSSLARRLHQVSFPLLVILFGLSVVVLALRRHWRALPLPVLIAAVAVYIPHGISMRRLYFLLPFALVTMALAWNELRTAEK